MNDMTTQSKKDQFLSLILENKNIIYKVCHTYCQNQDDREDLVQEIIIHLWKSSDRYNPQFKLSTWIYRISFNVAISFYRSENRRKLNLSPFDESVIELIEDKSKSEELDEKIQLLNSFINDLDKLNKALILLYLDDLSYEEISKILGITKTNVATKINRIKQKLVQNFSRINN